MVRIFAHYVVFQKRKFQVDGLVSLFIDKRCILLSGENVELSTRIGNQWSPLLGDAFQLFDFKYFTDYQSFE